MDLEDVGSAAEARSGDWASKGFRWSFRPPTDDEATRTTCAAVLAVRSPSAEGDLIVWTSGEAELSVSYLGDGAYRSINYDLDGIDDLYCCIDDLLELLQHRPGDELLHHPDPR